MYCSRNYFSTMNGDDSIQNFLYQAASHKNSAHTQLHHHKTSAHCCNHRISSDSRPPGSTPTEFVTLPAVTLPSYHTGFPTSTINGHTRSVRSATVVRSRRVVTSLGARARARPRSRPQTYFRRLVSSLLVSRPCSRPQTHFRKHCAVCGQFISYFHFLISCSSFQTNPLTSTLQLMHHLLTLNHSSTFCEHYFLTTARTACCVVWIKSSQNVYLQASLLISCTLSSYCVFK